MENNNLSISSEDYKGSPVGDSLGQGIEKSEPQENYLTKADLDSFIGDTIALATQSATLGEDLLEKAKKDLSNLVKKQVTVTKNGKTYTTTVYVKKDTGEDVEKTKKGENIIDDLGGVFVQKYSDKAVLVGGNTKEHLETLRDIKKETGVGRFNSKLKGWVFPVTQVASVLGGLINAIDKKDGGDSMASATLSEMKNGVQVGAKIKTPIGTGKVIDSYIMAGGMQYDIKTDSGRTVKGLSEQDFEVLPADDKEASEAINNASPMNRATTQKTVGGSQNIKEAELEGVPANKQGLIKDLQSKRDKMVQRLKNLASGGGKKAGSGAGKPKGESKPKETGKKPSAGKKGMSKAELNNKLAEEGLMSIEAYYEAVYGTATPSNESKSVSEEEAKKNRSEAMKGNQNAKKDGAGAEEEKAGRRKTFRDFLEPNITIPMTMLDAKEEGLKELRGTLSPENVNTIRAIDAILDAYDKARAYNNSLPNVSETVQNESAVDFLNGMNGTRTSASIGDVTDVDDLLFLESSYGLELKWSDDNSQVSLVDGEGNTIIGMTSDTDLAEKFGKALDNGYFPIADAKAQAVDYSGMPTAQLEAKQAKLDSKLVGQPSNSKEIAQELKEVKAELEARKQATAGAKKMAEEFMATKQMPDAFFKLTQAEQAKVNAEVQKLTEKKTQERLKRMVKTVSDVLIRFNGLSPATDKNFKELVKLSVPELEAKEAEIQKKRDALVGNNVNAHSALNAESRNIATVISAHKKLAEIQGTGETGARSEAMMGNQNAKKEGSDAKEPESTGGGKSSGGESKKETQKKEEETKPAEPKAQTKPSEPSTAKTEKEKENEEFLAEMKKKMEARKKQVEKTGSYTNDKGKLVVDRVFERKEVQIKTTSGAEVTAQDWSSIGSAEMTMFTPKNVLNYEKPNYIPDVNERRLANKQFAFDAVRMEDGKWLIKINQPEKNSDGSYTNYGLEMEENDKYYVMTGEQYSVMQRYYVDKAKALSKAEADKRTARNKARFELLPQDSQDYYKSKDKKGLGYKVAKASPVKVLKRGGGMYPSQQKMLKKFIDPKMESKQMFQKADEMAELLGLSFSNFKVGHADYSGVFQKGKETSYSKKGSISDLKDKYGINIKNQNGKEMMGGDIEDIKRAMDDIYAVFGDRSSMAKDYDLTVSHAGGKYQHASQANGVFIPAFNAIATTMKFGKGQFGFTLAHEFAHFMDFQMAKKESGAKNFFASHNPNSIEGKIAEAFRQNLNDKDLKTHEYFGNSHECFARALEQYFGHESNTAEPDGNGVPFDMAGRRVKKDKFDAQVKPLIQQFFKDKGNLLKSIINDLTTI